MIFAALLAVIAALILHQFLKWRKLSSALYKDLKGPPTIPILGSIPFLPKAVRGHVPKTLRYLASEYGSMSAMFMGPVPTIVISDAVLIKEMFKRREFSAFRPNFRPFNRFRYGDDRDPTQRGIILSSGNEWNEQRRFCLKHLKGLGAIGKNCAKLEDAILVEVNKLCLKLASDSENGSKAIDLKQRMNISIVNALWLLLTGQQFDLGDQKLLDLVDALDNVLRSAKVNSLLSVLFPDLFRLFHPRYKRAEATFEKARSFMLQVIESHKTKRDVEGEEKDFVHLYLDEIAQTENASSSFHLKSLDCVLIDLFMGGSETTSITLLWTFLFLLHRPEAERRLREELEAVLGQGREARLQDLDRLPFTKAVMHETLRLSAVVPCGVPHAVPPQGAAFNGVNIPGDVNVIANLVHVLLDRRVWGEDADEFVPQRFLDDKGQFRNPSPENFIPFSAGQRYCLGQILAEQEYFLFLSGIFQRFKMEKFEELPKYDFESDELNRGFVRYPPQFKVVLTPLK